MDEDLTQRIEDAVSEPASASVDGQSASAPPISQQIEGVVFVEGRTALSGTNARGGKRSGWGACRAAKWVPPGAQ